MNEPPCPPAANSIAINAQSDSTTTSAAAPERTSEIDRAATNYDMSWLPSAPQLNSAETLLLAERDRSTADPLDLRAGDIYGDFLIRSELGRGAIGAVFLAEQISLPVRSSKS